MSAAGWLAPDKAEGRKCRPGGRELVKIIESSCFCLVLTLAITNLHFQGWDPKAQCGATHFPKLGNPPPSSLKPFMTPLRPRTIGRAAMGLLEDPVKLIFALGTPSLTSQQLCLPDTKGGPLPRQR